MSVESLLWILISFPTSSESNDSVDNYSLFPLPHLAEIDCKSKDLVWDGNFQLLLKKAEIEGIEQLPFKNVFIGVVNFNHVNLNFIIWQFRTFV